MPIRRQRLLYTFAVLLASLVAGCKAQSSQTQTLPPAPAANSSSPAVTNVNGAPVSNANTSSSSNKGTIDACKLLTGEEIKTIQRDTLKDTRLTAPGDGTFIISQCFYTTNNFVNSVSLTVTQQTSNTGAENIRELWKQRFRSAGSHDKEREKASEEEEEGGAPPERVTGVGEEAYSVGNAKFGALYVLKGNKILRISVGGSHSQPERIQKMKSLAQYAVSRL